MRYLPPAEVSNPTEAAWIVKWQKNIYEKLEQACATALSYSVNSYKNQKICGCSKEMLIPDQIHQAVKSHK